MNSEAKGTEVWGSHRSVINSRKLTAGDQVWAQPCDGQVGRWAWAACSGSPGGNGGWTEDVVEQRRGWEGRVDGQCLVISD